MIIDNHASPHYVAIKSLSRFLSGKNSKHKGKEYFCMNCLQGFQQEISRDEHMRHCLDNETVRDNVHSHLRHAKRPMAVRGGGGLSNGRFPWTKWDFCSEVKKLC